jgi:hypothetical protein
LLFAAYLIILGVLGGEAVDLPFWKQPQIYHERVFRGKCRRDHAAAARARQPSLSAKATLEE